MKKKTNKINCSIKFKEIKLVSDGFHGSFVDGNNKIVESLYASLFSGKNGLK